MILDEDIKDLSERDCDTQILWIVKVLQKHVLSSTFDV